MSSSEPTRFEGLVEESRKLSEEISATLPSLVAARRAYMRSRSNVDKAKMDSLQDTLQELSRRHDALYNELKTASGLPEEVLQAIDQPEVSHGGEDRISRASLTEEHVEVTGWLDEGLSDAIDNMSRLVPDDWLAEQVNVPHGLESLASGTEVLSIVKGLRRESELSELNRFRQMIRVSRDYLDNVPSYDHFAGATLVPQLVQLNRKLASLKAVGGDVSGRIKRLWSDASATVDSTVFELLVAARCAEEGRNIEFIEETFEKSPDLRCHDPYPMVIECKRKRSLSEYELAEEAEMRRLFGQLEREAKTRGLYGRFSIRLSTEIAKAPINEIVARFISQRLAAHPERNVDYGWGSVAFVPLPRRVSLPTTRMYGPNMLRAVFGWNSDLPEWDGIICRVDGGGDSDVDEVRAPIGLVWSNSSKRALIKRAWSPVDLFADAQSQIPAGEFGLIYLAYVEGTRAEVADNRIKRFFERMSAWDHAASIRIPISFLVRLFPRALDHGQPDLIESGVRLYSGVYGEPALFKKFPTNIFTEAP